MFTKFFFENDRHKRGRVKKIVKLRGGHAIFSIFKWCFLNPTSLLPLMKEVTVAKIVKKKLHKTQEKTWGWMLNYNYSEGTMVTSRKGILTTFLFDSIHRNDWIVTEMDLKHLTLNQKRFTKWKIRFYDW